MLNNIERFIYYWRMPIIFFILFFVLLWIGDGLEGDAGGIIGAIWLFIDIPCLIFFTVRSIYLSIRNAITYRRTGVREETLVFPEINFLCRICDGIADEVDSVKELSTPIKFRYFALRLLSIVLIAGGIIGCFIFVNSTFLLVLFALVIIAGATFWIVANPITYNLQVESVRTIPCQQKMTIDQLYNILLTISTPLGTPRFATVRGFKKPVIVYGFESDAYIYVVYPARFSAIFYVSCILSYSLIEESSDYTDYDEAEDTHVQDHAYYLEELAYVVEGAVSSINAS